MKLVGERRRWLTEMLISSVPKHTCSVPGESCVNEADFKPTGFKKKMLTINDEQVILGMSGFDQNV